MQSIPTPLHLTVAGKRAGEESNPCAIPALSTPKPTVDTLPHSAPAREEYPEQTLATSAPSGRHPQQQPHKYHSHLLSDCNTSSIICQIYNTANYIGLVLPSTIRQMSS